MANDNPSLNYDEEEAVKFILGHLPQEFKGKFSGDEVNYIIDIVYEYYESKGIISENSENENEDKIVEIDEEDLMNYVMKAVKKDKIKHFTENEIASIIQGELDYCESLNIFE